MDQQPAAEPALAVVREDAAVSPPRDLEHVPMSLPEPLEYWADTEADKPVADSYRYLTALRQSPPGIKSFG